MEEVQVTILPDGRMDAKNASLYIGISEKTLAMFRCKGKGPAFVKCGKIFYFKDEVDAWLRERAFVSTAQARLKA